MHMQVYTIIKYISGIDTYFIVYLKILMTKTLLLYASFLTFILQN